MQQPLQQPAGDRETWSAPVVMGHDSVLAVLRRRGQVPIPSGKASDLLIPLDRSSPVLSGEEFGRFCELFGRGSFRKLARRLTAAGGGSVALELLQDIAGHRAHEYVSFLVSLGVAERTDDAATLARQINNIGPTLEWYVAELCKHELAGDAEWAVHLEGLPVGGDFDVLAWLAPTLVYVELKSAPPSEVTEGELRNFLERDRELAPDLSLLLIDTENLSAVGTVAQRLDEILLPLVRKVSGHPQDWTPESPFRRASPTHPGVTLGCKRVYLTGSKPSIVTQLRRVLQHSHAHVKGAAALDDPLAPFNVVSGEID